MYATGDRVVKREDGTLEYVGRRDLQLNAGGLRVEAGEIEAAIIVSHYYNLYLLLLLLLFFFFENQIKNLYQ